LWDRRRAWLIGIPRCTGEDSHRACADISAFLRSLRDPRALGLADCALAGMVGQGPVETPDGLRYVCPSFPCRDDPNRPISPQERGAIIELLAGRWPTQPADQLLPPGPGNGPQLCRNLAETALQGAPALDDECIRQLFMQPNNPWDRYAATEWSEKSEALRWHPQHAPAAN
jgi:hypothetical protein